MPDTFASYISGLSSPLSGGFAVAPSDTVDLPFVTRQIRVTGNAGNIAVVWAGRDPATGLNFESIEAVASGDVLDWRIQRIKAAGTTATGIRGYF